MHDHLSPVREVARSTALQNLRERQISTLSTSCRHQTGAP